MATRATWMAAGLEDWPPWMAAAMTGHRDGGRPQSLAAMDTGMAAGREGHGWPPWPWEWRLAAETGRREGGRDEWPPGPQG